MNKLTDTDIYMLEKLCVKYAKKSFSIDDAKKYFSEDENFTDYDFSTSWQHLFTINDKREFDEYIERSDNNNNFKILHKGLLYTPKPKEKDPWTHTEIIAVSSSIVSLIIAIVGIIY